MNKYYTRALAKRASATIALICLAGCNGRDSHADIVYKHALQCTDIFVTSSKVVSFAGGDKSGVEGSGQMAVAFTLGAGQAAGKSADQVVADMKSYQDATFRTSASLTSAVKAIPSGLPDCKAFMMGAAAP